MSSYISSSLSASFQNKASWKPKTLAGRLGRRGDAKAVQDQNIEIKEHEIIDYLHPNLKEEVLIVTNIGYYQYRREAFVTVGDGQGLVGLGKKCAGNSKDAIAGARKKTRLSVFKVNIPSNKTVHRSVSGQFGYVEVNLDPMINLIVAHSMIEKILELIGSEAVLQTGNCENTTGTLVEATFVASEKLRDD